MNETAPTDFHFPCDSCGAPLRFQAGVDRADCQRCGQSNALFESSAQSTNMARSLPPLPPETGAPVTVQGIRCQSCGAHFSLPEGRRSGSCPFCGSGVTVQGGLESPSSPQALLPIVIKADAIKELVSAWLSRQLEQAVGAQLSLKGKPRLLYLPFWCFDIETGIDFAGLRREGGDGDAWKKAAGHLALGHHNVLVPASRSFAESLLKRLAPWNLSALTDYDAKAVAGIAVELPHLTREDAYADAAESVEHLAIAKAEARLGEGRQIIHRLSAQKPTVDCRLLLMPVWAGSYVLGPQVRKFLVNAQTGGVIAQLPKQDDELGADDYIVVDPVRRPKTTAGTVLIFSVTFWLLLGYVCVAAFMVYHYIQGDLSDYYKFISPFVR